MSRSEPKSLRYTSHALAQLTALPALAVALCVLVAAPPASAADEINIQWLDQFLTSQLSRMDIPGAALAFVDGGEIRLVRGYGLADINTGSAVTELTLFRIGSVTKLFVWASLWQLEQQGKLDFDDDINRYLCGYALRHGVGLEIDQHPIRVRHLMDHTAGFDSRRRGTYALVPSELVSTKTLVEQETPPRVRTPGRVEAYSNFGTCVAARIIECVTGKSFEDYVSQHTFKPLGLLGATFAQPLPPDRESMAAKGYVRKVREHSRYAQYEEMPFELIRMAPAGAMSASARDMAAFIRGLLGSNPDWISEETLERVRRGSHVPNEHLGGLAHGFFVIDQPSAQGRLRVLWHGGDTILFHTLFMIVPERGFGLFVTYNAPEGANAYRELMNAVLEKLNPSPPLVAGQWTSPASVEGTYRSSRIARTTFEKLEARFGDLVVVRDSGSGGIVAAGRSWVPVSPWVFQERDGTDRLVFEANGRGDVDCVRLASRPMQVYERVGCVLSARIVELLFVGVLVGVLVAVPALQIAKRKLKKGSVRCRIRERLERLERLERRDRRLLVISWIFSFAMAAVALGVLALLNVIVREGTDAWLFGTPILVWVVRVCVLCLSLLLPVAVFVSATSSAWRESPVDVFRHVVLVLAVCGVVVWAVVWIV